MEEKKCKKCGTTENVNFMGMCENCYKESIRGDEKKKVEPTNSSNCSNSVADKFLLVVLIVKFIGYIGAVITAIIFMVNGGFGLGILSGVIIAISIWCSTLLFEAIAEGLNLLQDIKNKL